MTSEPQSLSFAADLPFEYVGGDASLDLVNTVDWTARGLEMDRLSSYERLVRWAEGAGVVGAAEGEALRRRAESRPREAEAAYRSARRLRSVVRRLYLAAVRAEPLDAALGDFNPVLGEAMRRLELAPGTAAPREGRVARWEWVERGERLDSLLWPVARAAADLLASPEGARVRVCGGEGCGWVFVDRSRNGFRRWCQMEVCGTREKSRRRADRGRPPERGARGAISSSGRG